MSLNANIDPRVNIDSPLAQPPSLARSAHLFYSAPILEEPNQGVFVLPGGYVDDDGALHTEVELRPLAGHDEEFVAETQIGNRAASVITGLLSRCLKRIGTIEEVTPTLVRALLVGDRDYLLLRLRAISYGPKVAAALRCPACDAQMDLIFSLNEIPVERKAIQSRVFAVKLSSDTAPDNEEESERQLVEFRLPTGADQEDLAAVFEANEAQALKLVLARCVKRVGRISGDADLVAKLPASMWREIEVEIERHSPQVSIVLEGICPECQLPFESPFDSTAFFLAEMLDALGRLERDVHTLARHYHWPERDILSLTPKKRLRYIRLLQSAMDQV